MSDLFLNIFNLEELIPGDSLSLLVLIPWLLAVIAGHWGYEQGMLSYAGVMVLEIESRISNMQDTHTTT